MHEYSFISLIKIHLIEEECTGFVCNHRHPWC